ncbi:MAG: hypothetical protein ACXWWU_02865 [Candidatus Limnocylindria bacterium]
MDEIGRRYLLLVLRLGRHLPDLIGSYNGPTELAEAVAGEAPSPAEELHLEALALAAEVAERLGGSGTDDRRRAWLVDQLAAVAASARLSAGEEIGFVDLVEELYGIAAEGEPAATFDSAQLHLAEILPPGGTLAARLAEHDRSVSLPAEVALRALRKMSNALRQRTIRDVWLPDGESVDFVAGGEQAGGFAATYVGGLRSRIELSPGRPLSLDRLMRLAGHEAYPGHHAEHAAKEALLIRERGLGEAMVTCRFTPAEAISESLAELGRGLVLDDQELSGVLRRLVRDLGVAIPDAAVEREVMVSRARSQLGRASANAALMAWHEGVPQAEVGSWLANVALIGDWQLEIEMQHLATLRGSTRAFRRLAGPRVVAEWLEIQGQARGLARLLSEQLTPRQLRAEIDASAG